MKKILLVEDNVFIRENMAQILTLENYDVMQAANGKEGLEMASTYKPDLILTDIMMPEMDGFEMKLQLRQNPETALIPLVFLSARSSTADKSNALSLGAAGFLVKPFNEHDLLELVGNLLGRLYYRHH